ncbi:hypothetical protein AC579_7531 [Pseudocercospora musae]|uniref:Uncharacterized protein n=1 Tax=Pseudocercospora musae TaxID=113226 RepID=A0A139I770_9PEZI|nr:hypothetical protein AC579_7531 [Pseudocercospora musae]
MTCQNRKEGCQRGTYGRRYLIRLDNYADKAVGSPHIEGIVQHACKSINASKFEALQGKARPVILLLSVSSPSILLGSFCQGRKMAFEEYGKEMQNQYAKERARRVKWPS